MQQKVYIVILLFLFTLGPAKRELTLSGDKKNNGSISTVTNLDSLQGEILNHGFTDRSLEVYEFHLTGQAYSIEKESEFLRKLPSSFQKSYLNGLIEKREGNFPQSFEILFDLLKHSPTMPGYYNELVSSADIAGKLDLVSRFIDSKHSEGFKYLSYLESLLYSAKGLYKPALNKINDFIKSDSSNPEALYQLSVIQRNLGSYDEAYNAILKAARLNGDGNPAFLSKAYNAMGAILYLSARRPEAEKAYLKALSSALISGAVKFEAKAWTNLGILRDEEGQMDSARVYYKRSAALSEKINDMETHAFALSELGVSYSMTNNLIEALRNYRQSYELYNKLGNRIRLSFLSDNIGKIYQAMFNFSSALMYYEKGLAFAGDNKRAQVLNLIGMADVFTNLSNYTKALLYYNKAKTISSDIKDISLSTDINMGLGALNFNLNQTNNAIKYYHAADDLTKNGGNPFLSADINNKCGVIYFAADSLAKAEKYFRKSILLSKQLGDQYTEAVSMLDLARLLISKNLALEAENSIKDFEKLRLPDSFHYLSAQKDLLIGKLFEIKKNYNKAETYLIHALSEGRKLNEAETQIEAGFELAKINEAQNNFPEAEKYYSDAALLIDVISRSLNANSDVQIAYFSGKNDIYRSYAGFLLRQKKYDKALEVIDRARSRNTMQNLQNLVLESILTDNASLDRLYEYEWMINSGIYNLPGQQDSIKSAYNQFKASLVKDKPQLKDYLDLKSEFSVRDMKNNLQDNEYLLTIFSGNDSTYLFITGRNIFHTVSLGLSREDINKMLTDISPYFKSDPAKSEAFYNQDLFSFNAQKAYELYDRLLKNALSNIPENSKLVIAPSPELYSLPFEFLITKFNSNQSSYDYRDKQYLIYKYNISYTPSAAAYIKLKSENLRNNGNVLLLGNPSINYNSGLFAERRGLLQEENQGLPRNIALLPLRYSKEEIDQINQVVNADKVLLSSEATKENFKHYSKLSSIIHLSTHSFLYNKQPLIFFSNTGNDNSESFLEAGEIVQLKLNSDLVVLSSCNSGLGAMDEAEGIIGMTKAFYEAGARSLVVSLWEVNDNYTSKLMTIFYKKLSEGFNKSEALRLAKIEFIKKCSPNPYYWSAFVLSGDTSNLKLKAPAGFPYYYVVVIALISLVIGGLFIKKDYLRNLHSSRKY